MSKPTPGPWTIHLAQTVSIRPRNSDALIARFYGARRKAEANARLSALSPELLEAIEDALGFLESGLPYNAKDRLRAMIAKAQKDMEVTNG
jgi:hypothetical protein